MRRPDLRAIGRAIAAERDELMMLLGVALVTAGLWQLSHAAALIGLGCACLWLGLPSRRPFLDRVDRKDS